MVVVFNEFLGVPSVHVLFFVYGVLCNDFSVRVVFHSWWCNIPSVSVPSLHVFIFFQKCFMQLVSVVLLGGGEREGFCVVCISYVLWMDAFWRTLKDQEYNYTEESIEHWNRSAESNVTSGELYMIVHEEKRSS